MARIISIFTGLVFVGVALLAFAYGATAYFTNPPAHTAEETYHLKPKNVDFSFEGPFGKYDNQQLQRGFQVYKEVCAACHGLNYASFRELEWIGFNEAEVKAIANQWAIEVPSIDPKTGDATTRKALPSDRFPKPYANAVAAGAANNNAIPPDQTLLAKARDRGPEYIYSLLTGYQDQPAEVVKHFPDVKTPQGLHYNPYFANLNLAMAAPLSDGQVTYADGTKATQDQMAKDVSAFLMWAAEPKLGVRHATGWATLFFLIVLTWLAWSAYRGVWSDKKAEKPTARHGA